MSRTFLPNEDKRVGSISDLRDLAPETKHFAILEGENSPADGGANLFWWDSSGDPTNADGSSIVASNVESVGVWRRIVDPSPSTSDDLAEGSTNLFFTDKRSQDATNALLSGGTDISLSYDNANDELTINFTGAGGSGSVVEDDTVQVATGVTTFNFGTNLNATDDGSGQVTVDSTAGGTDLSGKTTDDLDEGSTNLYYTGERVDNRVNSLLSAGSNINLSYDKTNDTVTVSATTGGTDVEIEDDGGSIQNPTEGINFGLHASVSDDGDNTVTVDIDDNLSSYNNDSGFITDLSVFTTDDLIEGSANLYFTGERVDDRVNNLLIGGTNVTVSYDDAANSLTINSPDTQLSNEEVQDAVYNNVLSGTQTLISVSYNDANNEVDYIVDGNLSNYTNDAGFISDLSSFTTDDLIEGSSNLYFTEQRARNSVSASGDLSYNPNTGVFSVTTSNLDQNTTDDISEGSTNLYYTQNRFDSDFNAKTTSDLSEGSDNLYYTDARVKNDFQAGGDINYNKDTLSGQFDLSTASFSGTSFDVSSEETIPGGVQFNGDGTKMFIVGRSNASVYEYDLTTGFDLSTASYSGTSFDVSSEDGNPQGVTFNGDGTKMFVVGIENANVYEYDLTIGFDVSTASYSGTSFDVSSEEAVPTGVQFNGDGTKMFVVGVDSDTVYEYDLTTGFDVSTASYSGTSFDVSSEDGSPSGVAFNGDGTKMFMVGNDNGNIYEYNLTTGFDVSTASFSGTSFDVSSEDTAPTKVRFNGDGTKMFMVGNAGNSVYEYGLGSASGPAEFSLDVSELSASDLFGSKTTDSLPEGENNLYYTQSKFDSDFSSKTTNELSEGSDNLYFSENRAKDVFQAGGDINYNKNKLTGEYDLASVNFSGTSFNAGNEDTDVLDVEFNNDGSKMFVAGDGGANGTLYEYNLTTNFDISTANFSQSLNVDSDGGGTIPNGIEFNNDGSKLFIVSTQNTQVTEYDLNSAFDISTASFVNSFDVSSQMNLVPQDVTFNGDGTRMFVMSESSDTIFEYNLTTGFDVSTASFTNQSLDVSSNSDSPQEIKFNEDGTRMFVLGASNEEVNQFNLTTGFELSTSSYSGKSFSVSNEDTVPEGFAINDDGTRFYMIGNNSDSVHEYNVGSPKAPASFSLDISSLSASDLFGSKTTDDLPEGSNLYFTEDRVKNRFRAGDGINYTRNSEVFDLNSLEFTRSFDVESEDTRPTGIAFNSDGTKMFVTGENNSSVFEYNLTVGYDVSTASLSQSFDLSNEDTTIEGVAFNDDGTKMFTVGGVNDSVYEYTLGTGFDVSTASYNNVSLDINSQTNIPQDIEFNNDGTKLFAIGDFGSTINEYTLTTPYDLSTASFTFAPIDVGSQTNSGEGFTFNSDGTKLFVTGSLDEAIHVYELTTGFDGDTASFSQTIDISSSNLEPTAITFNDDGAKLFTVDQSNSDVNEYDSGGPASFSFDSSLLSASELFGDKTTDDLPEGSTNLYYTDAKVDAEVRAISPTDQATFDGGSTTYNIPHGLGEVPKSWHVTAASADASGIDYVDADATNLIVNYSSAPTAGTDNVVLNWTANLTI